MHKSNAVEAESIRYTLCSTIMHKSIEKVVCHYGDVDIEPVIPQLVEVETTKM